LLDQEVEPSTLALPCAGSFPTLSNGNA